MKAKALVQMIGAPVACEEGPRATWRQVAEWASGQLKSYFGDQVEVVYYDLFDPDCPALPPNSQLPVVLVNQQVLTVGGKISVPLIRNKLAELGFEKSRFSG